jgi:phosphate:Na+ symporter
VLFLPFAGLLARLVERIFPEDANEGAGRKPLYLDPQALDVPSLATERIRMEVARIGETIVSGARSMLDEHDRPVDVASFLPSAADAEALYSAVVEYGRQVHMDDAGRKADRELARLMLSANHLMSVTDTVRRHLMDLMAEEQRESLRPTLATRERIAALAHAVFDTLEGAIGALASADPVAAGEVIERSGHVRRLAQELQEHLENRLADAQAPTPVRRYRQEFALLEVLLRVDYFAQRIAENVAAAAPPM